MSTQIFNGGIRLGILKAAKQHGHVFTPEQQSEFDYLDALPKNKWIDIDKNGKAITRDQAIQHEVELLQNFKVIEAK